MKKTILIVILFIMVFIPACSSTEVEPEKPTRTIVVPPLEFVTFVTWRRPFSTPMPKVQGEIVLAYDDFGNSQLFYSCSQERIESKLQLEKVEGIYFSIYWGYERSIDLVLEDASNRIDVGSMANFIGTETWTINRPEVITCARKMVNN